MLPMSIYFNLSYHFVIIIAAIVIIIAVAIDRSRASTELAEIWLIEVIAYLETHRFAMGTRTSSLMNESERQSQLRQ